jgi:hypothetical protein
MGHSSGFNSLAALIEAHEEALARWEEISRRIRDARKAHDKLEVAHEESNDAEREALAALMAHPVETLEEARLKAAYFLNLAHVRDFADETILLFMRSLVAKDYGDDRDRS